MEYIEKNWPNKLNSPSTPATPVAFQRATPDMHHLHSWYQYKATTSPWRYITYFHFDG